VSIMRTKLGEESHLLLCDVESKETIVEAKVTEMVSDEVVGGGEEVSDTGEVD